MILSSTKDTMPDLEVLKRKLHIKRPIELEKLQAVIDKAITVLRPSYAFKKLVFSEEADLKKQIEISKSLSEALAKATEGFVVICTLGEDVCKQLSEYQRSGDMVSAMYLDSFLSEAVENLAEYSGLELLERFYGSAYVLGKRYSPGYGDLSLDFQKSIFSLFDEKEIEVKISSKNYMQPEKSISYIVAAIDLNARKIKNIYE